MPRSKNRRRSDTRTITKDGAPARKRRPLWLGSREYRELLAMCTKLYVQVGALTQWVEDFTKAAKQAEADAKVNERGLIVPPGT